MFKRLLVLVDFSPHNEEYFKECIELASKIGAEIIAFNIVDINAINSIARHAGKRESEVAVELEEDGWKYLYMFEDMAKNKGVKTLVHQEEGVFESKITQAVSKYKVDLVCLRKDLNLGLQSSVKLLEHLLEKIDSPILLL
jgi:fructose/tagatose bisphosphate aldolase